MTAQQHEDPAARVRRYPVDRYPVQHATAQFHLGASRLAAGDIEPALDALAVARDVFHRVALRLEHAKATNMLGVAFRAAGRNDGARACFTTAREEFHALGHAPEAAAASYNLGLVYAAAGDAAAARAAWAGAAEDFVAVGELAHAAAALREHGASLLTSGEPADAVPLLQRAVELADRAGDDAGRGAAENVLGLAQLALGAADRAVATFRSASAAFPRTTRPAEHAMVKANLALAYEHMGDLARARIAARHAVALPAAELPVRQQARDLLTRIPGDAAADLLAVLNDEAPDRRPFALREEVLRLLDTTDAERDAVVRAYLDELLRRPGDAHQFAEALLVVIVELPPGGYEQLVRSVVAGSAQRPDEEADRLRSVVNSALARFAIPQWQRLASALNAAATAAGEPAAWR